MKRKIILTPFDKSLSGKYRTDDEEVFVLLDTTEGVFDVNLPDCTAGNNQEFIFKNIGLYNANLVPATGQYIDDVVYITVAPWDTIRLWSDLKMRWIVTGQKIVQPALIIGD